MLDFKLYILIKPEKDPNLHPMQKNSASQQQTRPLGERGGFVRSLSLSLFTCVTGSSRVQ